MSVSEIFIRRPVMTTLVMAAILLFGIFSFRLLPVSDLPSVDFPTIQVTASLPGASPSTMASSVATPLEKQFSTIAGVDSMTSVSALGISQITIQFALDRNIDGAAQDVQAAITRAAKQLPPDLPSPPTYQKVNPADFPVLFLAMSSSTLPLSAVDDYAENLFAQRISMVEGVAQVGIFGPQQFAVHVQVDPNKLAAQGLGIDTVAQAVAAGNVNQPLGTLYGKHQAFTIQANGQLKNAAAFRPLIVAYRNGNPVRLQEVANVIDSVQNDKVAAWFKGTRGVILAVQRQPGVNTVAVVDAIKRQLPMLRAQIPAAVNIDELFDRSQGIRLSVRDVERTLMLTVCLVVMVIFVFLRNISATVIPSLALPLSIVGTFAAMKIAGFSLDNLSLMALTLSVGFVVDDAIVMIENISRYIEEGETPLAAALKGSEQIGFTIVSLTVSLIAVLIPLLFMGDVVGRLFREFAVTLAVTILVSAVVSLTLTPMMCARLLRHKPVSQQGSIYRASERVFDAVISFYGRTLTFVLRHQFITLLVTIGTLVATVVLFLIVPKGFFPVQDTGVILGISEAPQTVSFTSMAQRQQQLVEILLTDPAVESISSFIGVDGSNTTLNSGRIQINLKPLEVRKLSASQIIARLQPKVTGLEGIQLFLQPLQDLTVEDRVSRTQFQYSLEDPNQTELATYTRKMVEELSKQPELRDVASDLQDRGLGAQLVIDRDTAARLGIAVADIDNTLYDAFGQRQVSTIFTQLNQYHVVMEVGPNFQTDPSVLSNLYVKSSSGTQVPLSNLAHWEQTRAQLAIGHQGQFPATVVSFNVAPGKSLGDAVAATQRVEKQIQMPASIAGTFQGTAAAFQASLTNEPLLILAALITVYIVLGVLYESYIHPITIISTLPSAGVGAILALLITRTDFSVIALIGVILLIGIVKKNAIMMIDFALDAERTEGKPAHEAIYQACLLRFRPIMMTTMAALLGGVPLAFGQGVGAELRQPLGITIVGGLLVSQLLTLYTTPVVYLYFDRLAVRFGAKKVLEPALAAGD